MTQLEEAPATTTVELTVNGERHSEAVPADETLLETLRGPLGITSVRGTCGIGVCGTCTVLADGRPVSSCLMLTVQAAGRELTTAEGLRAASGGLAPVQEAFVRHGAYQCSFCIPAMTLAVQAALAEPGADVASVRERLAGNLCRCGSYPQILEAVAELAGGQDPRESGESDR